MSASRSWQSKSIDVSGKAVRFCRRRSIVSAPHPTSLNPQSAGKDRAVPSRRRFAGTLVRTQISTTKCPLPPGRAAAIPTFETCRTRFADRLVLAEVEDPYAKRPAIGPTHTVEQQNRGDRHPKGWRLVLAVFLPFAAGYYLSFFFRTINAAISPTLASEFGLDAAKIGL